MASGSTSNKFDNKLVAIAEITRTDEETNKLGTALNIETHKIASAQVENRHGIEHMGTLNMLRAWRKGQHPSKEDDNLQAALEEAGMIGIQGKLYPETDTGNQGSAAQTPTFTQGAFTQRAYTAGPSGKMPTGSTDFPDGKVQFCSSPSSNEKWQGSSVKKALHKSEAQLKSEEKVNYTMWKSQVKGTALIIGNGNFTVKPRPWVKMDIYNMGTLLERLGYSLRNERNQQYVCEDLSAEDMNKAINQFTTELKNMTPEPQSAVVYISSHGSEQGITGIDGKPLSIQDLLQHFCKVLPGKPKVIIIDACWGGDETVRVLVPNLNTEAQPCYYLPENADIFMIHSTSYGKKAWSYTEHGSLFVNELCKVVYDQSRQLEDLDTIMLWVTKGIIDELEQHQEHEKPGTQSTTVIKQGVTRKLFFYPGLPSMSN